MQIYDELVARGLIAQVTDEKEIRDLVNNGKATFYIGFDPTADSLHVGHFMALCLMKRLQQAGNKPIALIGGGTAMIGDPSGRTDMRQMMTRETIQHNCDCFKKQMSRFIDFSDDKALMVNNADWLLDLNYVDVLREVGAQPLRSRRKNNIGLISKCFHIIIHTLCIHQLKHVLIDRCITLIYITSGTIPHDLGLFMAKQETYQFSSCIPGCTDNSNLYHKLFPPL